MCVYVTKDSLTSINFSSYLFLTSFSTWFLGQNVETNIAHCRKKAIKIKFSITFLLQQLNFNRLILDIFPIHGKVCRLNVVQTSKTIWKSKIKSKWTKICHRTSKNVDIFDYYRLMTIKRELLSLKVVEFNLHINWRGVATPFWTFPLFASTRFDRKIIQNELWFCSKSRKKINSDNLVFENNFKYRIDSHRKNKIRQFLIQNETKKDLLFERIFCCYREQIILLCCYRQTNLLLVHVIWY